MWMQILKHAGFPVLGRAFPRDWSETIRAANPEGFYESPLRHGIYARTNPNPRSGVFLAPYATGQHAVKVFARGLARTERAYLNFVIACVRDPREYSASLERLYAMERDNKLARAVRAGRGAASVPSLSFAPALLEWWNDNVTLLNDAARRHYPICFVDYAAVLRDPAREIERMLVWLGAGDRDAALVAVKEQLRTQRLDGEEGPRAGLAAWCDELYQRLARGTAPGRAFLARVARAHQALLPRIREAEREAREARKLERERVRTQRQVPLPSRGATSRSARLSPMRHRGLAPGRAG
jgi:hypothetical protein